MCIRQWIIRRGRSITQAPLQSACVTWHCDKFAMTVDYGLLYI